MTDPVDDAEYAQDVLDDRATASSLPETTDPATIPADEGDSGE